MEDTYSAAVADVNTAMSSHTDPGSALGWQGYKQ